MNISTDLNRTLNNFHVRQYPFHWIHGHDSNYIVVTCKATETSNIVPIKSYVDTHPPTNVFFPLGNRCPALANGEIIIINRRKLQELLLFRIDTPPKIECVCHPGNPFDVSISMLNGSRGGTCSLYLIIKW